MLFTSHYVETRYTSDIVVRFCVEINSNRILQKSTIQLFATLSQNQEIPIVIVGMKKDEFLKLQFSEYFDQFPNDRQALQKHRQKKLEERMNLIDQELSDVRVIPNGRFDAIVPVSKGML